MALRNTEHRIEDPVTSYSKSRREQNEKQYLKK